MTPMNIDDIERILGILKANEVTDFELEQEGTKVKLTRGSQVVVARGDQPLDLRPAVSSQGLLQTQAHVHAPEPATANLVKVESPIVGTFYRRPSPDAEAFVKEGDIVKKGDTLCIIEAMKLMNEIEAETSGKLVKILAQEGQVVEYGETIFLIDPTV